MRRTIQNAISSAISDAISDTISRQADHKVDTFDADENEPLAINEETKRQVWLTMKNGPNNAPMIEPAVLNELRNQQKHRFYYFKQYRIPSNIQTAFVASAKIYRRDIPPESLNYRQLKGHPLEKRFRDNMEDHMRQHRVQFKSWTAIKMPMGVQIQNR